jgi:putative membrane protein insertion efficiency factor
LWLCCIAVSGVLVHDLLVPVPSQYSTKAAVFAIEEYRAHASKRVGRYVTCRFTPTCSKYGLESVKKYGAFAGGLRAGWRILRCGPWTPMGTVDPP